MYVLCALKNLYDTCTDRYNNAFIALLVLAREIWKVSELCLGIKKDV